MALAAQRLSEAIREGLVRIAGDQPEVRSQWLSAVEKRLGGEKFRYDRPQQGARVPIDALTSALFVHDDAVAELEAEEESEGDKPEVEVW